MSGGGTETEIKFRIPSLPALRKALRAAGFRQIQPSRYEHNILYDTPSGELRRRGELVRLRRCGREWTLTHKGKAKRGRYKSRFETETKVRDVQEMRKLLAMLGLRPGFAYEKYRATWTDGKGEVVIDRTPIGDFGEIEGKPRWIDATVKRLGLAREDCMTRSYGELFRDWRRRSGNRAEHLTWRALGTSAQPRPGG